MTSLILIGCRPWFVMRDWQIEPFQRRLTLIWDKSAPSFKGTTIVGASNNDLWGNAARTGEIKASWRSARLEIIVWDYTD